MTHCISANNQCKSQENDTVEHAGNTSRAISNIYVSSITYDEAFPLQRPSGSTISLLRINRPPQEAGMMAHEERSNNRNNNHMSSLWNCKDRTKEGECSDERMVHDSPSMQLLVTSNHRRSFCTAMLVATMCSSWGQPAGAAIKGAKGAAEYDMEYYLRDLVKGNTREGNLPASTGPPVPPPRTLQKDKALPFLLDDTLSTNCSPMRALVQFTAASNPSGQTTDVSTIREKIQSLRSKSSRAFSTRAPWTDESVTDEYYFDVTAYAVWRTAAELIPNFVQRDAFAKAVGKGIYDDSIVSGLLPNTNTNKSSSSGGPLTASIPRILQVLTLFQETGFCEAFRLGEQGDESRQGSNVFDEYDDDDFKKGNSVDCLISIFRPATLGASLQITGEGSRFSPEFVGTTLTALLDAEFGIRARYETYFVDQEYRANPKDFFPNEQLLQFTLTKK
eukprot:scaffold18244_cov50-Attheya_sp.AAC.1